ncbi:MAG: hypothetical protein QM708_13230 [Propioniciclava sp.]|uniref:hypothetical protein n=1 Tax=Propioniciclava sp. TaxID=2038686 RepID=UPI0039E5040B
MTGKSTLRAPLRMLIAFMLAVVGAAGATVVNAVPAHALCITSPLAGTWSNVDPNTRSVTKAVVSQSCDDVVLCPVGEPCTGGGGSQLYIRPFGKCHPSDCDWGTSRLTRQSDGWYMTRYVHSWATKTVWVKTYQYWGRTYLRFYVYTDFTAADGRTDYVSDEWMLK